MKQSKFEVNPIFKLNTTDSTLDESAQLQSPASNDLKRLDM